MRGQQFQPDGQRHITEVRPAQAELPQPTTTPHKQRTVAGHGRAGVKAAKQAHHTVPGQFLHAPWAVLGVSFFHPGYAPVAKLQSVRRAGLLQLFAAD